MIKKFTRVILILIPVCLCSSAIRKDFSIKRPQLGIQTDTTLFQIFDFEYIKSKTTTLEKDIEVSSAFCGSKNNMKKSFISTYLSAKKISIGEDEYLDPNNFDGFCFKQYKIFKSFNLFTFTYENGTCCKTLYAATTKKESLDIINIVELAFSGNKDGWIGDKYGKWISEDVMDLITISYYDDDFVEDNNNSRVDSTWSIIKMNKKGVFKEHPYKRIKYLDGRKIE